MNSAALASYHAAGAFGDDYGVDDRLYFPHIFEVYQEDQPRKAYLRTVLAMDWDDALDSLMKIHLHEHNPRWVRLRQRAIVVGGKQKSQRGRWIWNKPGKGVEAHAA